MQYIQTIRNIEEYEKYLGREWPFSPEAFDALNEYYNEEEGRYLHRNNDGTPSIEKWKEFHTLKELVDYIVNKRSVHQFVRNRLNTDVPEDYSDGFWDYFDELRSFAEEELGITIIFVSSRLYLSM